MKKNAGTFSKNSTTQGNIRIFRLKKTLRNVFKWFKPGLSNTLENFWLGGLGFQFLWDLIFLRKFG